jgi:hypothetical protein
MVGVRSWAIMGKMKAFTRFTNEWLIRSASTTVRKSSMWVSQLRPYIRNHRHARHLVSTCVCYWRHSVQTFNSTYLQIDPNHRLINSEGREEKRASYPALHQSNEMTTPHFCWSALHDQVAISEHIHIHLPISKMSRVLLSLVFQCARQFCFWIHIRTISDSIVRQKTSPCSHSIGALVMEISCLGGAWTNPLTWLPQIEKQISCRT